MKDNRKIEGSLDEGKCDLILKNTLLGIAKVDVNHNILYANPAFCKALGYSLEELKKLTFRDFTYPDCDS